MGDTRCRIDRRFVKSHVAFGNVSSADRWLVSTGLLTLHPSSRMSPLFQQCFKRSDPLVAAKSDNFRVGVSEMVGTAVPPDGRLVKVPSFAGS